MTDEKDQTSSDNTTSRYRALVGGICYPPNAIFIQKRGKVELEYGGPHVTRFYCRDNNSNVIFAESVLIDSPDFERVEEYWEQGVGEYRYRVEIGWPETKVMSIYLCEGEKSPTEDYFRDSVTANSCLDEAVELIKKRSKESRRLDNA